jgi:hypothetical protein
MSNVYVSRTGISAVIRGVSVDMTATGSRICTVTLEVAREHVAALQASLWQGSTLMLDSKVYNFEVGDEVDYYPVMGNPACSRHRIAYGPIAIGDIACWKLEKFTGLVSGPNLRPAGEEW